MCRNILVPFELANISQPLFVRFVYIERAVQNVFRDVLGIFGSSSSTVPVILDGRFDILDLTDALHPLIVRMDVMVVAQIVIEPSVAFIWDFFKDTGQTLVLLSPATQFPGTPLVVGGMRHMKQGTGYLNGTILFLMTSSDCPANQTTTCF